MTSLHVVGDSISIHYGPHLQRSLGHAFEYSRKGNGEGALDDTAASNGGDSGMVLSYLQGCATASQRWDVLLVNCGLHDVKTDPATRSRMIDESAYRRNLLQIAVSARSLCRRMVWVRTTPIIDEIHNRLKTDFLRCDRDVVLYNQIADSVMRVSGVRVVDLYSFTADLGPDAYCDHVHFSEPVRHLQASFIAGHLLALKAQWNI